MLLTTRIRSESPLPLRIPVQFRVLSENSSEVLFSETADVSLSGMFMETSVSLRVGTPLALSLQIPPSISGSYPLHFHCTGRVVHSRHFADGHQGYGVRFDHVLSITEASPKSDGTYLGGVPV